MCKRVKVADDVWAEVEEALERRRLFEAESMPELTHGLCPRCTELALGEANAGSLSDPDNAS